MNSQDFPFSSQGYAKGKRNFLKEKERETRGMKGDERRLKQVESKRKRREKIVIRKEASPSQDLFKSLSLFLSLSPPLFSFLSLFSAKNLVLYVKKRERGSYHKTKWPVLLIPTPLSHVGTVGERTSDHDWISFLVTQNHSYCTHWIFVPQKVPILVPQKVPILWS